MGQPDSRSIVERYVRALPADFDVLDELRHPEFEEELPQSREVIRGSDNFRAIHENYPGGTPQSELRRVTGSEDQWVLSPTFTLVRIVGEGDTFTTELEGKYPDGSEYVVVSIIELRDSKVWRARTYFAPVFEPPSWRAQWVEIREDA